MSASSHFTIPVRHLLFNEIEKTIDFKLSENRDMQAAKFFFEIYIYFQVNISICFSVFLNINKKIRKEDNHHVIVSNGLPFISDYQ